MIRIRCIRCFDKPDLSIVNFLSVFCFGAKSFELLPKLSYSTFIFWGSRNTLFPVTPENQGYYIEIRDIISKKM